MRGLFQKGQGRLEFKMLEGTEGVVGMGEGVMSSRALFTIDLIGSSERTFRDMKRRLDEIRREDA
jgi:hypothetical protein